MEGMRLLCRAHNQFAAEQTFGAGFMRAKREFAQCAADERRSRAPSPDPPELDVTPWLRKLGLRAGEARRLAECSEVRAGATLDARLRAALRCVNSGRAPQPGP